ncbi:unnamed protein product, partial [Clonostachys solani]
NPSSRPKFYARLLRRPDRLCQLGLVLRIGFALRRSRCLRGEADVELTWKDAVARGYECQSDRIGIATMAEATVIIIDTACSAYSAARIADGVVYVLIEDDRWSVIKSGGLSRQVFSAVCVYSE